jgi:hypothetical protein
VGRTLVVAAVLALALTASSAHAVIVVQRSIGGVKLQMTKAQVRAKLGRPIGSGGGRVYYSLVWVGFRLGRVTEVTTTHSNQRTRSGVSVDSTEAAVKRAYPSVTCAPSGGFRRCRLGSGDPGTRATDFLIGHGRVLQVTVQLLPQ